MALANIVPADFSLFHALHLGILAAPPLGAAALAFATRRFRTSALATRITLAAILAADGLFWHSYRYYAQGVRFPEILPLEMCDASFWLTAVALLTLEEHTFDLAYYWGIAGSGMALLTPYLRASLRTFQSFQYFTGHSLLIIGVLYLIWSRQSRPRARSWWFALWTLNLYGALVAVVDFLAGTNFMYLRQKPASSSLFDLLGPWPWYIAGADLVALTVFWLMQQPFRPTTGAKVGMGAR
jgi:hypothetical integral membrane protein (TIGR02206 family)